MAGRGGSGSGMVEGARWRKWVYFNVPMTVFIVGTLFPFYWMFVTAFRPDGELYRPWRAINNTPFWTTHPTIEHFRDLMAKTTFPKWLWNTFFIACVSTGISLFCGLLAGYAEGVLDQVIMRPLDILMAFPAILLAIALTSVFGTGVLLVSLALAIVYVPIVARVVRAAVLATKAEVYVEGARAVGATARRLVLRHIVPNCVTPLLVQASVLMAIAILVEAALSFLGVGVRPPTPSLGLMLSDGRGFMLQAPWVVVFPGLAILIAVLGFNMLADGLRDWLDPQRGAGR